MLATLQPLSLDKASTKVLACVESVTRSTSGEKGTARRRGFVRESQQ